MIGTARGVRPGPRLASRAAMIAAVLLPAGPAATVTLADVPQATAPHIVITALDRVAFTAVTPLAGNAELARRTLTPLQAAQLPALLAARQARMADQPIDPAAEVFGLRVPLSPAADGRYGLLVFVPPWQAAAVPADWLPVLDAAGMIVVTAARQGNPESPLGRREPMAVLAAWNAMQRHPVDPDRVFIAGFSGGAKVALKLAVAYPDLFRGVIADAGAYPIGTEPVPLPPADLFDRFRQRSTVVLVAGSADTARDEQAAGAGSLRQWCVVNVTQRLIDGLGHEPVSRGQFQRAFADLTASPRTPPAQEDKCWQRRLDERDAALARAELAVGQGDAPSARRRLVAVDRLYGGLAAPRSVALMQQLPAP